MHFVPAYTAFPVGKERVCLAIASTGHSPGVERPQDLHNLSYGNYACETPRGGKNQPVLCAQAGREVRLKVWTVLGMASGGPFRKQSRPAGPWREPSRGPASCWTAIKRLLWEAFRLLGEHQEHERYVTCSSVPRESPPSVRLGKRLSAPSLGSLLRKDVLSEYRMPAGRGDGELERGQRGLHSCPCRTGDPTEPYLSPRQHIRALFSRRACCETFRNVCVPSEICN